MLPRASRGPCATITGAFERDVLRESLGPARSLMGISSRKGKDRPTHHPMRMERDGRKFIGNVPVYVDALLQVDMDTIGGDVVARLRLFPQASTPVYVVVVGRAHEGPRGLFQGAGRRLS